MEAGELGLYMFFTRAFATLLQHPASPVRHFIVGDLSRRVLMGLAMGYDGNRERRISKVGCVAAGASDLAARE